MIAELCISAKLCLIITTKINSISSKVMQEQVQAENKAEHV